MALSRVAVLVEVTVTTDSAKPLRRRDLPSLGREQPQEQEVAVGALPALSPPAGGEGLAEPLASVFVGLAVQYETGESAAFESRRHRLRRQLFDATLPFLPGPALVSAVAEAEARGEEIETKGLVIRGPQHARSLWEVEDGEHEEHGVPGKSGFEGLYERPV